MSNTGTTQRVIPMLSYEDCGRASEWLQKAFGFRELERFEDDGRVSHVNLEHDGELIMLGWPSADYESPKRHREHCEQARTWSQTPYVVDGTLVYVDDLDAHLERARAAGATILTGPDEAHGQRQYRAEDIAGHRWMFAQTLDR